MASCGVSAVFHAVENGAQGRAADEGPGAADEGPGVADEGPGAADEGPGSSGCSVLSTRHRLNGTVTACLISSLSVLLFSRRRQTSAVDGAGCCLSG